eukprot:scaffold295464_cov23-Tisochrysis_lutea.AAC.1
MLRGSSRRRKSKLFVLELTVVVHVGRALKIHNTILEGDSFEFITAYDTVMCIGDAVKSIITPELMTALQKFAVSNGATPNRASIITTPQPASPPLSNVSGNVKEILLALPPSVLKNVNVSVDASFWEWHGGSPPQPRYVGKPTSWACQDEGAEVIRIKWEKGRGDDGNIEVGYAATASASFSDLEKCALRLEAFDDGAAPPRLSSVAQAPASTVHLLSSTDLSDINVVVARAKAMIVPAAKYFELTLEGKRGAQLARMKAVRFFNPKHVLAR